MIFLRNAALLFIGMSVAGVVLFAIGVVISEIHRAIKEKKQ